MRLSNKDIVSDKSGVGLVHPGKLILSISVKKVTTRMRLAESWTKMK